MDLESTQYNSLAKLPLLKQEEGKSFKPVARTTANQDGTSTTTIPGAVTDEEKIIKKNDLKARRILMMTLLSEHLLTFNKHKDAKSLFEAIEARFGGNEATKKTQKTLLKQKYETFSASNSESLDYIFNRLQKIVSHEWGMHFMVWRNKSCLGSISFDDLYNNFKIVEPEVKKGVTSSSNSGSQNLALVSGHCSTNDVNTADVHVSTGSTPISTASTNNSTACLSDATVYAYLATQPNGSQVVHEDLDQIHKDDIDEIDLKGVSDWQIANMKAIKNPKSQENRSRSQDSSRRTVNVEESSSKAMIAIDGTGFDWSLQVTIRTIDENQISGNNKKGLGYNVVPPPLTGLFAPPSIDLSNSGLEKFKEPEFEGYGVKVNKGASENVSKEAKKTSDAPIIEDWVSDSDEDETVVLESINVQKPKQADQPRKVCQNPRNNNTSWNTSKPKILGAGFQFTPKACFVCGSFNHLIKDCDFHDKKMVQKPVLNNVKKGTGQKEVRPIWTNAMRVNQQKISNSRRNFAPTAVLTKSGLVPFSAARPFNTVVHKPFVNVAKPRTNVFQKAHSSLRRPFYQQTVLKNRNLNNKVNTAKVSSVNIVKGIKMTSTVGKQGINVVKPTAYWAWRPKDQTVLALTIPGQTATDAKDSEVCKITRKDGSSIFHGDFQALLRRLDRQDLSQLYSLVQGRFKNHPLEGHDLDLWGDLRMIFDPNEEDDIWLNQQYWELLRWKLHEYSGVHSLFLDGTSIQINMLVEKKYPLTKTILEKMINLEIEAEEDSNMAIKLIKFIKS
ncbi:hypothetical protein Tco_0774303 [Tanacetum coccineum]|uniref:Uncharacterized protein n=1 Tax=Tanacetum coccineum TaxID=301880 RepID=A0ABQ4ZP19_9ASTR